MKNIVFEEKVDFLLFYLNYLLCWERTLYIKSLIALLQQLCFHYV